MLLAAVLLATGLGELVQTGHKVPPKSATIITVGQPPIFFHTQSIGLAGMKVIGRPARPGERPYVKVKFAGGEKIIYGENISEERVLRAIVQLGKARYKKTGGLVQTTSATPAPPGYVWALTANGWQLQAVPIAPAPVPPTILYQPAPVYVAPYPAWFGPGVGLSVRFGGGGRHGHRR